MPAKESRGTFFFHSPFPINQLRLTIFSISHSSLTALLPLLSSLLTIQHICSIISSGTGRLPPSRALRALRPSRSISYPPTPSRCSSGKVPAQYPKGKGGRVPPPGGGCFDDCATSRRDTSRRRAAFRRLSEPQPGDSSPGTRGKELACTKLSDVFVPPISDF
jgi:hypothetical protein